MPHIEDILDYVFKKLDKGQEEQFELALDHDEILADTVDGIIIFCNDFNITSKEEFYKKWGEINSGKGKAE